MLIIVTTQTLQMCYAHGVCRPSEDGSKLLCTGQQPVACPIAPPTYECKRPDGTTYIITEVIR